MGQKSEKFARGVESRVQDVERRMSEVERRQMDSDRYIQGLVDLERRYSGILKERRRQYQSEVSEVRREAGRWKLNAMLALVLLALVGAVCIVQAGAEDLPETDGGPSVQLIPDPGSLPGDDVPALVQCSMTPEEAEAAENEMIEAALFASATRLDDVTVTHYCTCVECCGKSDGITASGLRATPGVTVAVDPDVIPLGADVLVDYGDGEIRYYRADDTGGAIRGNRIDLCVETHDEALGLGRRTATVWWVMSE